jgi:hypothetical protein
MFTYGYIREAVLAHLDIDEEEAQDMKLLSRFHIFANEAVQAICASKPMYQYIDVTVVEKFDPIVTDEFGSFFRPATTAEINWDRETQGDLDVVFLNEDALKKYYHEKHIYEVSEKISMSDTFIAFANKYCWKIVDKKPSVAEQLEAEAFNRVLTIKTEKSEAKVDYDFSYLSKNQLKFYKPGRYLIPAKYMWYRFDSGLGDNEEIDMPSDILLTIPLYIASICLQMDNLQKSQILRQQFELALSRCTATDMLKLNEVSSSW